MTISNCEHGNHVGTVHNTSFHCDACDEAAERRTMDLSDPAVRRMAELNHQPTEQWTNVGTLIAVRCYKCGQRWPCRTAKRLREMGTA